MASDDGYVEDSEGEESMLLEPRLAARKLGAGIPPPPRLQLPSRAASDTVSTIATPDFTGLATGPKQRVAQPPRGRQDTTVSEIQTANFTVDRSVVSDISSFGPAMRAAVSSIQTAQTSRNASNSISSISTMSSVQPAPKPKPKPRPVKRKDKANPDSSVLNDTSSSAIPSSAGTSVSFLNPMPPPPLPVQPSVASSFPPTATTELSTDVSQRIIDSGVEMADLGMMDIAERAKLRSRARSQKGKQVAIQDDDVIELSSSDDELSILPASKSKSQPKSKKTQGKTKENGKKAKDPSKPTPKKRAKTSHDADGFESDVNTIPMPTSDFPIPPHISPQLPSESSQLPPSDPPPPSTSGSTSSRAAPRTSQDLESRAGANAPRDESPFSSPPPLSRKRKRPAAAFGNDSDFDADEDSVLLSADVVPAAAKAQKNGRESPAPLPSPIVVPETQAPPAKPKPAPRRKRKGADDDDDDWAAQPVEKPAKSRKKARVEEEDEDEWAGDGPSKPKAKAKKAVKKAAAKKKAPPKKATKAKGKPAAEDKPFSSKEVIEDSDAEAELDLTKNKDEEVMPPPPAPAPASKRMEKTPSSPVSANHVTDPVEDPSDAPASKKGKGKQRAVILSDDEEHGPNAADISTNNLVTDIDSPTPTPEKRTGGRSSGGEHGSKENAEPESPPTRTVASSSAASPFKPVVPVTPNASSSRASFAHTNRTYTISNKKSTPMSELIRKVASLPSSPFPHTSRPTYSPLAKASKSMLRRIAPLHPNRRTPPPPPPKAPPKPKSKKMLELEEKWEMELEESVDGWYALPEGERAALRRAKRDHELGFED
ncbi:hypothetical protein K466DRAFT_649542 [Polyporus arcularius HHB13444]|uniref:Uncharacterized protein n=1 Tax=Polyporus arcularius HHB13444 TaxID=1314778 RepID=A0A5C3Q1H4_9APHY|nr:hypothetical protein K466DRAFT_649542 [Polyporus arcularius HHB13444]